MILESLGGDMCSLSALVSFVKMLLHYLVFAFSQHSNVALKSLRAVPDLSNMFDI